jgi:hypothetical protein
LPFLPGKTLNFAGAKFANSVCANIPSSATVVLCLAHSPTVGFETALGEQLQSFQSGQEEVRRCVQTNESSRCATVLPAKPWVAQFCYYRRIHA